MKPDYSEYLKQPGMLDYIEKEWIDKPEIHDFHAGVINDFIKQKKIKGGVLEVGCGTGNLAKRITWKVYYNGVDLNEECIRIAKEKNPHFEFAANDVRNITHVEYDLVFTFGFLKHFGLHEWSTIFGKICSLGGYLIFDIPIAEGTKDDGVDYHHVWLSMEDIKRNIDDNGFEILEVKEFGVEPVFICRKK